ncbi:MAG: Rieske (2Fe-2S) protein [Planctomycetota bacterium]|nr:Rieske (2Fe-2S) protein [Planctomycetota bacterium]
MTRRDCLAWLARAAAGCAALQACPARAGDDDEKERKLANLMALPNNSAKEYDDPDLILVRTDRGIACYPRVCTHRHTPLAVGPDGGIVCPLHGSQFDLAGKPTNGPATRALRGFQVRVDAAGNIFVTTGKRVAEGTFAPLPDWAKPKDAGK